MSLRDELIEAGTARVWHDMPGLMDMEAQRVAGVALDAFLDKLAERVDDLWLATAVAHSDLATIIAFLRAQGGGAEGEGTMNPFKQYRRIAIAEMADWHPDVDMAGVSISEADRKAGSPKLGDKIARNPENHEDRWLVGADYFVANFEPLIAVLRGIQEGD